MIYTFLATGFEEVEALGPIDVCRRAGLNVKTVSVTGEKTVTGAHGVGIVADSLFEENDFSDATMLFLPGGMPGSTNLDAHEGLRRLILEHAKADKPLAAICAAPMVYGKLGLTKGKKATCYPSMEDGLVGAETVAEGAVIDGNVITGRGMGASLDFAFALVEVLRGREKADEIAKQIVYEGRK